MGLVSSSSSWNYSCNYNSSFGVRVLILIVLVTAATVEAEAEPSKCGNQNVVVFVFGDSNSDTGGLKAGLGYPVPQPNGRLFFRRSTGRFSDGRIVLDFLCRSLNIGFLSPYLDSLGTDFSNGASFAVAGSCTLPRDKPFSLYIQVLQFLRFKSTTLELASRAPDKKNLMTEDKFRKALYMIDIGQNDLAKAFDSNSTYDQVIASIPTFLSEIKDAIKTIYDRGGKNFWVHNTGPLGCLPQKLSMAKKSRSDLDPNGCLVSFNNAAKKFNMGLSVLCDELRTELKNATIVYTDIYRIKYDLIASHSKYGFESPLMSCCGFGGPPYNYNINITCGNPGSQACPESLRFLNWDGVHYTEAANSIIASKILSTDYSKPKLKLDYFCSA